MDMMPPQSPPAIVIDGSPETQQATAALERLIASRRTVIGWRDALPAPPEPGAAEGVEPYIALLYDFWNATDDATGWPRKTALARLIADTMRDEARLRALDGSLDAASAALVARAIPAHDIPAPLGIQVRELTFGPLAYAGALILQDDAAPDIALLFLPGIGWERHASLDQLIDHVTRRFGAAARDVDGVPGMTGDDLAQGLSERRVGSRRIDGAPFARMAQRFVDVQSGKLRDAWSDFHIDRDLPGAQTRLADRMRDILRLDDQFDITGLLTAREVRLVDTLNDQRLAATSAEARSGWKDAAHAYDESLRFTASLRATFGIAEPMTPMAFARRELAASLKALGIDTNPDDIDIDIYQALNPSDSLDALRYAFNGPAKHSIPLMRLAFQNIGAYNANGFRGRRSDGGSLGASLGDADIRRIIARLDLSTRYQAHLESVLREGPVGRLARLGAIDLQAARMRFEAADARLSYVVPGEPHAFIDDHAERGFRWVEAALDARTPQDRRKVEKHDVVVYQVTYKGTPVRDVLLFGVRASQSATRIVLYTPDAPDGRVFREFDDRGHAARAFLYAPAFREYLLDRLPAEYATVQPNGIVREFKGDRRAHWVLSGERSATYTLTEEPFGEREVVGDFLEAAYDTAVELRKADMRFIATSHAEADWRSFFTHPLTHIDASPDKSFVAKGLLEIPASAVRAIHAGWRMEDHLRAGNHAEAFVAFTEAYTSALNVITPSQAAALFRTSVVRASTRTTRLVGARAPASPPAATFESRYVAKGVSRTHRPDAEGIHRIGDRTFIEHEGRMYGVQYDKDFAVWRLDRPGAIDTRFTGPAIESVGGHWTYARHVGLEGGMRRRLRDRFNRLLNLGDDAAPVQPAPPAAVAELDEALREFNMQLPPNAEHLRPAITDAWRSNRFATFNVRIDGTGFRTEPPMRSAVILGEGLTPDVAALSIHQRRRFMEALEQQFPVATERAVVLSELGWARHGRRVPSLEHVADDVQVPLISSSDDIVAPAASPAITTDQSRRWQSALESARQTPLRAGHAIDAGAAAPEVPLFPGSPEFVPFDQWPDRLWYYADSLPTADEAGTLWLGMGRTQENARVTSEIRLTTLPPDSPTQRLDTVLGIPAWLRRPQHEPLRRWVEIDPRPFAERFRYHYPYAYELHRQLLGNGEYVYTLRANRGRVRIPSEQYASGSRAGMGIVRHSRP